MSKTTKKPTKIMKLIKSAKPAAKKASLPAKVKMKAVRPMKAGKPSSKPAQPLSELGTKENKGSRRGFMWKALERKQQKQKEQQANPSANPEDRTRPTASPQGFARFNGPRRRVG